MSSSSRNFLSDPYQNQSQRQQSQSRSPSLQSSSSSHPTAAPTSPALDPSLVHPGLSQNLGVPTRGISNLVDPTTIPAVPRLTGTTDLGDLTQQGPGPGPGPVRSGVRGVRSFSSPPLAIGLNAGLSDSSLYPGANLGIQSASASAASGVPYQSRGRLSAAASAPTNQSVSAYSLSQRSSDSGSEAYLSGNMAPEAHSWSWQSRQSNPHNPQSSSSMGYDQPFHPSQSLPQESFPLNYNVPQGSPRGYYQSGGLPSPYLSVPPAGPSQPGSQPRSASMSYTLPSNAMTGNMPNMTDPSYLPSSPSYFPGQSDYYLPVSSHPPHSSIPAATSPQPPPGPAYSSPESGPASVPATSTDPDSQVRVLSFRPKPQCWEHGCNGREFSTFSNLLRHQREKSGVVAKAECPICGAAFTRTTARNIHVAQGKCRGGHESSTG